MIAAIFVQGVKKARGLRERSDSLLSAYMVLPGPGEPTLKGIFRDLPKYTVLYRQPGCGLQLHFFVVVLSFVESS